MTAPLAYWRMRLALFGRFPPCASFVASGCRPAAGELGLGWIFPCPIRAVSSLFIILPCSKGCGMEAWHMKYTCTKIPSIRRAQAGQLVAFSPACRGLSHSGFTGELCAAGALLPCPHASRPLAMLPAAASQSLAADLGFCLRWCRHLTRKLGKRSCVAATRPAVSTAPCWRVQLQL